jgi:hypothetical protein
MTITMASLIFVGAVLTFAGLLIKYLEDGGY